MHDRIFLSPPDVGPRERELLAAAFDSNWIAPLGPEVDAFEEAVVSYLGEGSACALASGTAALHLALLLVGVKPGDEVLIPSLTFVATANAVVHAGATPIFIDSTSETWTIDPALVSYELRRLAANDALPAAVMAVDLYGQSADYEPLRKACDEYGVPLISDAAEALGARYQGKPAGTQADLSAFSFNGNKIITTSGGGMLVGPEEAISRARYLASQARQPAMHYEHTEVGFNYRMSNLLAAVGRAQFETIDTKVDRCRAINRRYQDGLRDLPLSFMPEASYGRATCWLTVVLLEDGAPILPIDLCRALEMENVEARPAWKPMHLQPVFSGHRVVGGEQAQNVYSRGVCLPSGTTMTESQQDRVMALLAKAFR